MNSGLLGIFRVFGVAFEEIITKCRDCRRCASRLNESLNDPSCDDLKIKQLKTSLSESIEEIQSLDLYSLAIKSIFRNLDPSLWNSKLSSASSSLSHEQFTGNHTARYSLSEFLKALESDLSIVIDRATRIRRRIQTGIFIAPLILVMAGWIGALIQSKQGEEYAEKARRHFSRLQLAAVHSTYVSDLRRWKTPSKNFNFIDRSFWAYDLERTTIGTTPTFRRINSFADLRNEIQSRFENQSARFIVFTGRTGAGGGYTAAHLIHTLYQETWQMDRKSLWPTPIYLVSDDLDSISSKSKDIQTYLVGKICSSSPNISGATANSWIRGATLLVDPTQASDPEKALVSLLAFALPRSINVIVWTEYDNYLAWSSALKSYQSGMIVTVGPYVHDKATLHQILTTACERKGIILTDPLANYLMGDHAVTAMAFSNWTLLLNFLEQAKTLSSHTGKLSIGALSRQHNSAVKLAIDSTIESYAKFVADWLRLTKGVKGIEDSDISDLLHKVWDAVESCELSKDSFTDEDFERIVLSTPRLRNAFIDQSQKHFGHKDEYRFLSLKIKGSPLFRSVGNAFAWKAYFGQTN